MSDVLRVRAMVLGCRSCSLVDGVRRPVPFSGPVPSDIVVVGEAPGRVEDETGKPFVGPAGELARRWIEPRFGEVAWVNAVSCFPNRTPTTKEVVACRVNLHSQLSLLRPKLILVFGGVAVSSWLPDTRIGEVRGRWWKANVTGLDYHPWAMATWHPAAVLRNKNLEIEVLDDLRVFRESVGENSIPPYAYRTCIKCGSAVIGHLTEEGIAWCVKHWEWKTGKSGQGKTSKVSKPRTKKSKLFD